MALLAWLRRVLRRRPAPAPTTPVRVPILAASGDGSAGYHRALTEDERRDGRTARRTHDVDWFITPSRRGW